MDNKLRLLVYRWFVEHSRPPSAQETAQALEVDLEVVREALIGLGEKHILVLEPDTVQVRMAMPFAAVPTDFRVQVGSREYWANCAWDALGIPAMLHQDAVIDSRCGDCGEPITLNVHDSRLIPAEALVHFALPVARWWDDIVDT